VAGRDGRRARRTAAGVLTFAVVVALGTAGVVTGLRLLEPATPLLVRCSAVSDGTPWHLQTDQADTAALLTASTVHRGMPARAATIALATGLQESKLRNIDYGDRDSVGIFQQRPSQGWGTVEQIMDPVYSTHAFLDALDRVDGYEQMEITVAAQTVQRSGFPDAYAQHEGRSRAWASALTGWSPASLTCSLPAPDGPGDARTLADRVARDFGGRVVTTPQDDGAVVLRATDLGEDAERLGWALAHWAVAVAHPLEVVAVRHDGRTWDRSENAWTSAPDASPDRTGPDLAPGEVLVLLAG
jgi:hypothetical protein